MFPINDEDRRALRGCRTAILGEALAHIGCALLLLVVSTIGYLIFRRS